MINEITTGRIFFSNRQHDTEPEHFRLQDSVINLSLYTAGSLTSPSEIISADSPAELLGSCSQNQAALDQLNMLFHNYNSHSRLKYYSKRKQLTFDTPMMMGILNVTPDSFSDGGNYFSVNDAIAHGCEMFESGIDIVDVGGESTRPGSDPVGEHEEMRRVLPVISALHERFPEKHISIDTYRSKTAAAALSAGATIVNDISGGLFDREMYATVAAADAIYVLMHTSGTPKNMQSRTDYLDVRAEIYFDLHAKIGQANAAGVEQIIVDPGIGFGKTVQQNYELISHIDEFRFLGYPVLTGVSRKSFIGKLLNTEVSARDTPTSMLEMFLLMKGVSIVRTHNHVNAMNLMKLYSTLYPAQRHLV